MAQHNEAQRAWRRLSASGLLTTIVFAFGCSAPEVKAPTPPIEAPAPTVEPLDTSLSDFSFVELANRCDKPVTLIGTAAPTKKPYPPKRYQLLPDNGEPVTIEAASDDLPPSGQKLSVSGTVICMRVYFVGGEHSSELFVREHSRQRQD